MFSLSPIMWGALSLTALVIAFSIAGIVGVGWYFAIAFTLSLVTVASVLICNTEYQD